ncbi:MAG: hypothetical protein HUK12_08695 [Muribaculaceae bacterium]|nr:hypothetical protein [Muribaculaceae bacterium]
MRFLKTAIASLIITVSGALFSANAQQYYYCGPNTPIDSCMHEASGFLSSGVNFAGGGFFMGPTFSYKQFFPKHWYVGGSADLSFGKNRYGLYAKGGYWLHGSRRFDFFFEGKVMYNRYSRFNTNEVTTTLLAIWEGSHFNVHLGTSLVTFSMLGSSHTETPVITFGASANIMPRKNSWNIGIFFRNYDEFYYENWNINWGANWYASLGKRLKMYGEVNLRPAGSLSQLATRYEFSFKAGVRYHW